MLLKMVGVRPRVLMNNCFKVVPSIGHVLKRNQETQPRSIGIYRTWFDQPTRLESRTESGLSPKTSIAPASRVFHQRQTTATCSLEISMKHDFKAMKNAHPERPEILQIDEYEVSGTGGINCTHTCTETCTL